MLGNMSCSEILGEKDSSCSLNKAVCASALSGEPRDGEEGKLDNERAAAGDDWKSCNINRCEDNGDACVTVLAGSRKASAPQSAPPAEMDWGRESSGLGRFADDGLCVLTGNAPS